MKKNQINTDKPIPFALSLVLTDANNAIAVKITERNKPVQINIKPVSEGSYSKTGMPIPTRKATDNDNVNPVKILNQSIFRFNGCATNNSRNSDELYT